MQLLHNHSYSQSWTKRNRKDEKGNSNS